MWKTIKGWFGWAEHEIEDILSDFHAAISKLDAVTDRKQGLAKTKEAEAAKAQAAAVLAQQHADEAAVIRTKLRDLISGTATPAAV